MILTPARWVSRRAHAIGSLAGLGISQNVTVSIMWWNLCAHNPKPKAVSVVFHRPGPVKSLFTSARDSIDLATTCNINTILLI